MAHDQTHHATTKQIFINQANVLKMLKSQRSLESYDSRSHLFSIYTLMGTKSTKRLYALTKNFV